MDWSDGQILEFLDLNEIEPLVWGLIKCQNLCCWAKRKTLIDII